MKAMVLKAPGALIQEDLERPSTGMGDSMIRVTHTGICGTTAWRMFWEC